MTKNELRRIAEKLGQGEPPCCNYHLVDEVAEFCDEPYCNDLCDPTECWEKVLKNITENGKSND